MIVIPEIFKPYSCVLAAMSTRGKDTNCYENNMSLNTGDTKENVLQNRKRFFGSFSIALSQLAIPQQKHTTNVRLINSAGEYSHCDGLITHQKGVFLVVTIADCAPILMYETTQQIVIALHAGWRGTAFGIVHTAMDILRNEYFVNEQSIKVFIGPSAGDCCYEIQHDVAQYFTEKVLRERNRKLYLNIKAALKNQLVNEGILASNIEIHNDCTICNKIYHSFRRDGKRSGRMMAFIGKIILR